MGGVGPVPGLDRLADPLWQSADGDKSSDVADGLGKVQNRQVVRPIPCSQKNPLRRVVPSLAVAMFVLTGCEQRFSARDFDHSGHRHC